MFYFAVIIVGALIAIIVSLVIGNRKRVGKVAPANPVMRDDRKPVAMSSEEKTAYDDIVSFTGHESITQEDVKAYQIHSIIEVFASVPGGDFWDESVHNAQGQYDRLRRGVLDPPWLIALDKERGLANVLGSSDRYYLTSVRRCSCPDYRNRHLPCKHMYWLAITLADNEEPEVHGNASHPLLGLTFAAAGRFPGKGKDDFIKQMKLHGAEVETTLTRESTALICVGGRSGEKTNRAEELDMEIMTPDEALNLFHGEGICQ